MSGLLDDLKSRRDYVRTVRALTHLDIQTAFEPGSRARRIAYRAIL